MNMEEVIIEVDKQMQATNRLRNKIIKQTTFNEDLPRQKMMALVDLKFLGKSKLKDIAEEVSESRQTLCMMYNSLEKDGYVNYVNGANIAGFVKVADAMIAQGIV